MLGFGEGSGARNDGVDAVFALEVGAEGVDLGERFFRVEDHLLVAGSSVRWVWRARRRAMLSFRRAWIVAAGKVWPLAPSASARARALAQAFAGDGGGAGSCCMGGWWAFSR